MSREATVQRSFGREEGNDREAAKGIEMLLRAQQLIKAKWRSQCGATRTHRFCLSFSVPCPCAHSPPPSICFYWSHCLMYPPFSRSPNNTVTYPVQLSKRNSNVLGINQGPWFPLNSPCSNVMTIQKQQRCQNKNIENKREEASVYWVIHMASLLETVCCVHRSSG